MAVTLNLDWQDKMIAMTQKNITKKKKINMEFLENGNFNGIKFMGSGNIYNGYLNQEQTWKEYRQWALKNIYDEEN